MSAKKSLTEYMNGVTRVGMLTIICDAAPITSGGNYRRMMRCRCDCGVEKDFDATNVRRGKSTSCGCQFYRRPSPISDVCHGIRHGKLTVIGDSRKRRHNKGAPIRVAVCRCDCGNEIEVPPYDLRSGNTKSCGCAKGEFIKRTRSTHGMSKTPEYAIWAGMKARATKPHNKAWDDYGGRGVGMCERWEKFENFFEDMGLRPDLSLSLDRKRNNEGYSKDNCHWATKREQVYNRRNMHSVTVAGFDIVIADLAERTGLSSAWIKRKVKDGLSGDEIVAVSIEALERLLNS